MAEKKPKPAKRRKKPKKPRAAQKSESRKPQPKKAESQSETESENASSRSATSGLDKSVEQFRESLEQQRDPQPRPPAGGRRRRGQTRPDDPQRRREDALRPGQEGPPSDRLLLKELERLVKQARKEVGGRTAPVRKQATQAARRARKKLG